jgi:hypothetical protein|mmetsp:Transcript_102704/g.162388  ORF Transcript_102704/g.162388 Transcript_102704/m.162388 type:complete len:470 (+) Transcript_102704:130-1539(+)
MQLAEHQDLPLSDCGSLDGNDGSDCASVDSHPLTWICQTPELSPIQSVHADPILVPPLSLDNLPEIQGFDGNTSCGFWTQGQMPSQQEGQKRVNAQEFSSQSTAAEDTDVSSYSDSSMSSYRCSGATRSMLKPPLSMPPGVLLPQAPSNPLPLADLVPESSSKLVLASPGLSKPPGVLNSTSIAPARKGKVRIGIMIMPGDERNIAKNPCNSGSSKVKSGVMMMPFDRADIDVLETPASRRLNTPARSPNTAMVQHESEGSNVDIEPTPYHARLISLPLCAPLPKAFGTCHRLHNETRSYGTLSQDRREFTKTQFQGLLSVVTEDQVHTNGVHNYMVRFTGGDLSSADGVGFVFSPVLPCAKNIQRIVSIFVNRAGRICMRARNEVKRSDISVKPLELGDWIVLAVDLNERIASFSVWPSDGSHSSSASLAFGSILSDLKKHDPKKAPFCGGHFACVVKNEGVSLTLAS